MDRGRRSKGFFGSADQSKLITLVAQQIADGRILRIIDSMLKAGCQAKGQLLPTEQGTPQGAVISPLLSNILLTPFDWEMRRRGCRLTRYADDWVITCRNREEAKAALEAATKILEKLGVELNEEKTRIVHVRHGFEFLGFKIKRGSRPLHLPADKIKSGACTGKLYAYPRQKSVQHFKDQVRKRTSRKAPVSTKMLIEQINPVIRGWGTIMLKPTFASFLTNLIAGSCGASGRTNTSDGGAAAGRIYLPPSFTATWDLSTRFH